MPLEPSADTDEVWMSEEVGCLVSCGIAYLLNRKTLFKLTCMQRSQSASSVSTHAAKGPCVPALL